MTLRVSRGRRSAADPPRTSHGVGAEDDAPVPEIAGASSCGDPTQETHRPVGELREVARGAPTSRVQKVPTLIMGRRRASVTTEPRRNETPAHHAGPLTRERADPVPGTLSHGRHCLCAGRERRTGSARHDRERTHCACMARGHRRGTPPMHMHMHGATLLASCLDGDPAPDPSMLTRRRGPGQVGLSSARLPAGGLRRSGMGHRRRCRGALPSPSSVRRPPQQTRTKNATVPVEFAGARYRNHGRPFSGGGQTAQVPTLANPSRAIRRPTWARDLRRARCSMPPPCKMGIVTPRPGAMHPRRICACRPGG